MEDMQQHEQATTPQNDKKKLPVKKVLFIGIPVLFLLITGIILLGAQDASAPTAAPHTVPAKNAETPSLKVEPLVTGYSHIWDAVFMDADNLMFSTRSGELRGYTLSSKRQWLIAQPQNIRAEGEGGLMGLALDKDFASNKSGYMCYNATGSPRTVRVARFTLASDFASATDFTDIIPDIESQAGRHSGCRIAINKSGVLWVATGDSALPSSPQNPKSLAGKILRTDRNGKGVEGNLSPPYDPRIFSYGHRNTQGLVLFDEQLPNGAYGFSSEHGPDHDDEINWVRQGNFGWDPSGRGSFYNESVPMTDISKYPDAVKEVWSSGSSTIAVAGMAVLKGDKWKAWEDRVVMAVLKNMHVRLMDIGTDGTVKNEQEILADYGRIRSVIVGPDNNLYLTTDNGKNEDAIIRVIPS